MRLYSFLFPLFLCVLLAAGCGKKAWPQPETGEEIFAWQEVTASLSEGCLRVRAKITGNVKNIDQVTVQIEYDQCPSCPFLAQEKQTFFLPSPVVNREAGLLTFTVCPKQKKIPTRIQLVGTNHYRQFSPQYSQPSFITQGTK